MSRQRFTRRLSEGEHWLAEAVGQRRQWLNRERPDTYDFDGDGEAIHVQGAAAECAVARLLDRYWDALHDAPGPGDVGKVEVRHTDHRGGGLIVHPKDEDTLPVVLVTGMAPLLVVHGWTWMGEAKQPRFWNTTKLHRNPGWLVPQDCDLLRDMREFPRALRPEADAP